MTSTTILYCTLFATLIAFNYILYKKYIETLSKNKQLQSKLSILQVQNRELSKLPINHYKYKKLQENLLIIKERSLRGDITGKQFCKEVATIIKLYC